MSMVDKFKDKSQQALGSAKEKLGKASGNEELRNSGKADQTSGEAKEAGHELKDKATGAVQDVKDKLSGGEGGQEGSPSSPSSGSSGANGRE